MALPIRAAAGLSCIVPPNGTLGNRGRVGSVPFNVRRIASLVVLMVVAGCGTGTPGSPPSTGSQPPSAEASTSTSVTPPRATAAVSAAVWRLRYALLSHYPNFAYCDPDLYPVARGDEQSAADDWWAGVDRDAPEVQSILAHRGWREPLTAAQRLDAYRDHKKLTVIVLTPVAGGYEYQLSTSASGGEPDQTVAGLITLGGEVRERSRRTRPGGCPICLDPATRIATPAGAVPVAQLKPGDMVWTVAADGHHVAVTVQRVARRDTPGPHLMLRLALADGRVLVAAGAHPTVDGNYLRQLRAGHRYDGATVVFVAWVSSTAPATYDLLPDGPTGAYWADGVLVGSTLRP